MPNHNTLRRRTLYLAAAGTAFCNVTMAQSEPPEEDHLYFVEQFTYDDNLFRRADDDTATAPAPTREDYINRLTVGVGDDMRFGEQIFRIKGSVQDVRFQDNDYLDHTAGEGSVSFDWRMLRNWSGRFSGDYKRVLVDFANTLGSTTKDLIETYGYGGSLKYGIGPRWSLSASGRHYETEHDLLTRQAENLEADQGRVSLDYVTPSHHSFGLEYRYTEATFPEAPADTTVLANTDYEESVALARFTYTPTIRTQLRLSGGYVKRERIDRDDGNYSGDTWRAELDWKPREKFGLLFSAWSELKAYIDSESDYFISDGFGITPSWSPIESLKFKLSATYEDQEYIASRILQPEGGPREDEVLSGLASFIYEPRPNLQFELNYRYSDRDSNREQRIYDAQVAGASIRWKVF